MKPWTLALTAMALTWGVTIQAAEVVRVVGDAWCPYNCDPTDKERPGLFVEILSNALKGQGIELRYELVPWARAVHEANEGKVDGLFSAAKDDLKDAYLTKDPIASYHDCFFTAPDSTWSFESIKSLESITLAYVKDYAYAPDLLAYIQANPKKTEAAVGDEPLKANIRKVLAKRVEALVEDKSVAKATILEMKTNLRMAGCGGSQGLYIPFSKKSKVGQKAHAALEAYLATAGKSGELARLKVKYQIDP